MCKLPSRRYYRVLRSWLVACLALCSFSQAQILYQDEEAHVHHLPSLMAVSHDPSYVLLASLDTILHDKDVCCGTDSALEDSVLAADPKSLKDVAGKLEGRHLLSDGRPIKVTTEYLAGDQVTGGHLVKMIHDQHPALMEWNSHLYVVHGVVYFWVADESGGTYAQLRKLLLWDTRYSDARREVSFTLGSDDAGKIEGFLFVQAVPQ